MFRSKKKDMSLTRHADDRYYLQVRPASYNWFGVFLDREDIVALMLALLGELVHQGTTAVAKKLHSA